MGEEYIRRIMVLGSVPHLGPVVLFDDIEDLLKWVESGTGGDSVFEKIATVAFNGSASLHAKTRTTGAAENDTVTATRKVFQRPGKRYRHEIIFRIEDRSKVKRLYFSNRIYDGTNQLYAGLVYLGESDKWGYVDSGGTTTDLTGGAQALADASWHRLMYEWDENSGEYIRMVCDGLEVDMSGLDFYSAASANAVQHLVELTIQTAGAAAAEWYFDDVLILEI